MKTVNQQWTDETELPHRRHRVIHSSYLSYSSLPSPFTIASQKARISAFFRSFRFFRLFWPPRGVCVLLHATRSTKHLFQHSGMSDTGVSPLAGPATKSPVFSQFSRLFCPGGGGISKRRGISHKSRTSSSITQHVSAHQASQHREIRRVSHQSRTSLHIPASSIQKPSLPSRSSRENRAPQLATSNFEL